MVNDSHHNFHNLLVFFDGIFRLAIARVSLSLSFLAFNARLVANPPAIRRDGSERANRTDKP
jgi:hypothetical protein